MAAPGGNPADLMGAFRTGLTGLAASFNVVTGAVQSFGNALGKFVSLFSPVAVQQFNFAVRDLMASIGEALVPVLQMTTGIVRFLGDVFAGITRQIQPLINGGLVVVSQLFQQLAGVLLQLVGQSLSVMIPVWQTLVGVFQSLIPVLMPIIQLIVQVAGILLRFQAGIINLVIMPLRLLSGILAPIFELIMTALQPFLEGMTLMMDIFSAVTGLVGELAQMIGDVIGDLLKGVFSIFIDGLKWVIGLVKTFADWVRDLLGIAKNKPLDPGDARGKAVTNTSQTNVQGLSSKMQTSAFALGGSNPAAETAKNTQKAHGLLETLNTGINNLKTDIKNGIRDGIAMGMEKIATHLIPRNPVDVIANLIP